MGQYYNRLRAFRDQVDFDTASTDTAYAEATSKLQQCRAALATFKQNPGLEGQTWNAAAAWLSGYENDLSQIEEDLRVVKLRYDNARQVMNSAKASADSVSPVLVSHFEGQYVYNQESIQVNGETMSGREYIARLEAEREAQREAECKRILDTMNNGVRDQATNLTVDPATRWSPDTGGDAGSSMAGSVPGGSARTTVTSPSAGGSMPAAATTGATAGITTGTSLFRQQVAGGSMGASVGGVFGARTGGQLANLTGYSALPRPDLAGPARQGGDAPQAGGALPALSDVPYTQHVINPTWTSDGPVGGYTPPSVLDANDPRWSPSFGAPSREVAGSLVTGGVLGLGGGVLGQTAQQKQRDAALGQAAAGVLGGAVLGGVLAGGAVAGGTAGQSVAGGLGAAGGAARIPSGGVLGAPAAGLSGTSGAAAAAARGSVGSGAAGQARVPVAGLPAATSGVQGSAAAGRVGSRGGAPVLNSGAAGARGAGGILPPLSQQGAAGARGANAAGQGKGGSLGAASTQGTATTGKGGTVGAASSSKAGTLGTASAQGNGARVSPAAAAMQGGKVAGSSGAQSAAARGVLAPGAASREERRRDGVTLVGYEVDRLDDERPVELDDALWAGGSIDELAPLPDLDADDRW